MRKDIKKVRPLTTQIATGGGFQARKMASAKPPDARARVLREQQGSQCDWSRVLVSGRVAGEDRLHRVSRVLLRFSFIE